MIRDAKNDDMESVLELMKQLSNHEFTKTQFMDCYSYNLNRGCVLVYEENNIVSGCLVFNIHYRMHYSRKTAEIVNFIVDKNARNQGIGKQMLTELEKIAAQNECVIIEVASGKKRESAHRFYYREGFICDHYKFTKELQNATNFL